MDAVYQEFTGTSTPCFSSSSREPWENLSLFFVSLLPVCLVVENLMESETGRERAKGRRGKVERGREGKTEREGGRERPWRHSSLS